MDINLPRIPEGGLRHQRGMDAEGEAKLTNDQKQQQQGGKPGDRRGFGFILYEDQRSTVLAVDNLNGFQLLNRTLRVDHVRDYKMPKRRNEEGEIEEPTGPSRNAAPQIPQPETRQQETNDDEEGDMDDPMAAYIARSKSASDKGRDEDKEEKKRRKEQRRMIREERERRRKERDSRDYRHDRDDEKYRNERQSHSRTDNSASSRRERELSPKHSRDGRDHHRYSDHRSSNRERERRSDSRRD